MVLVAVFIAAAVVVGGMASYVSQQSRIPQLQHRPGTPIEVVESCRQAVIIAAQAHASERGVQLVRVDATSAGVMRAVGRLRSAPIEVGVVYWSPSGQEIRQGVIECRVDRRGRAVLANFSATAR